MSRALLNTSVLIARATGEPLDRPLPEEVAVSVVTLAQLELGVLTAQDDQARATRLRTLTEVRAAAAALPIDERTASAFALLHASARRAGRRVPIHDAWIAATAVAHGAEVWTRDEGFEGFADAVKVVRV